MNAQERYLYNLGRLVKAYQKYTESCGALYLLALGGEPSEEDDSMKGLMDLLSKAKALDEEKGFAIMEETKWDNALYLAGEKLMVLDVGVDSLSEKPEDTRVDEDYENAALGMSALETMVLSLAKEIDALVEAK